MKPRNSLGLAGWPATRTRQEKLAGSPLIDFIQGVRDRIEDAREIVELQAARLDAEQAVLEPGDETAQARIGGHVVDQRFGLDHQCGIPLEILDRLKQQAVPGEEFAAAKLRNRLEALLVLGKLLRECRRRLARQFWRRRFDHDENPLEAVERVLEGKLALAPAEIGRQTAC